MQLSTLRNALSIHTHRNQTVRHTCKLTYIWIRKYFSSLSPRPANVVKKLLKIRCFFFGEKCVIRIQLQLSTEFSFICLDGTNFRLIDDSRSAVGHDVRWKLTKRYFFRGFYCLDCKCAFRWARDIFFCLFQFQGSFEFLLVRIHMCRARWKKLKRLNCTRELPHQRMYFQLRLHNQRSELRHSTQGM